MRATLNEEEEVSDDEPEDVEVDEESPQPQSTPNAKITVAILASPSSLRIPCILRLLNINVSVFPVIQLDRPYESKRTL